MTLVHNFDEVIDRHGTNSSKWLKYPADVLPMWVADSDFHCAKPIVDEMKKIAEFGVYGYPYVNEGSFEKATVSWCKRRHDWTIEESMIDYVPSLGTALAVAVKAFCEPGDKVLMQTPIYPPFQMVAQKNHCEPSCNSLLRTEDGKVSVDWEDFEKRAADPKCKLFLLCNPHNPTGHVFSREDLSRMVEICYKNGVKIFSDEVHADYVYTGHEHVVLPTVSEHAREITIVGLNPSKTFNVPGIRTAATVTVNPELKEIYSHALGSCKLGRNLFGICAYVKCYNGESDYYADQVNKYIEANLHYAVEYFHKYIPQIKAYMPDATYLMWLDCTALPFDSQAALDDFFVKTVKVGLNPGNTFGKEGERFLRMNVACPRATLEEGLRRIRDAVSALTK